MTRPQRLTDLGIGDVASFSYAAELDAESRDLLRALGLTDNSVLRVCKQGEPCIIQVRTTRIGISSRIAQHVMVTRTEAAGAEPMLSAVAR